MGTFDTQVGSTVIRREVIDSMVKQIAKPAYKFKQAVAIVPTNAWTNTFYREQTDIPAGQSGNTTKGISRGAAFPQYAMSWQEVSVKIVKFGLEDTIHWEDILSNNINVQARTVINLTLGVVKGVDDEIWDKLSQSQGTASTIDIASFALSSTTDGGCWDETSASILDNLMRASQIISENNYDVGNLMCFISPRDKRSIMDYLADKGAQFPSIATTVANNGNIGRLAGIQLIESNSVTASCALVVKPKVCATWKQLVPLKSTTIEDPYKSVKIRVVEEGALELTDPKSIVLITNTQR